MRVAWLVGLLILAVVAACDPESAVPIADAGATDAASDAVVDATPPVQLDAGRWGTAGVRITLFRVVRPCELGGCVTDLPPLYSVDDMFDVLLRTRSMPGEIQLRVGTGARLEDGGSDFTFANRTSPPTALATVGEPYAGATGPRTLFATQEAVTWGFNFMPGQPPLEVRDARFGGSVDALGLATSDDPAMGGIITGCFTPAAAEKVFLDVFAQNLKQFLYSLGAAFDVDCTRSGSVDGWAFEAKFEASEVVELQPAGAADGG